VAESQHLKEPTTVLVVVVSFFFGTTILNHDFHSNLCTVYKALTAQLHCVCIWMSSQSWSSPPNITCL